MAKESRFGERIVHGILVTGLISATIGMKLPGEGGTVYIEQNVKFIPFISKRVFYIYKSSNDVVRGKHANSMNCNINLKVHFSLLYFLFLYVKI